MKESCMVALTWAKHNYRKIAEWMNIEEGEDGLDLNTSDIDVHVNFPSCEAEKNVPAGATIATHWYYCMVML